MDKILLELVSLIAAQLEPPLAVYATLSSQWQHAVELRNFFSIQTDSDDVEFDRFRSIFAAPRRQKLLRSLLFCVRLPSPSEKRIRKLQSRREAAANCLVYTRALVALFSYLHTWELQGRAQLALEVTVSSPMDNYANTEYGHKGEPIWKIRNRFREVSLDAEVLEESGGIPRVPVVSAFAAGWRPGRRVDSAAMPLLAKALPNARKMDWAFYPLPRRMPRARKFERLSLANALFSTASVDMRQLTTLHIHCEDADPLNDGFDPTKLVDHRSGRDDLSNAFRHLSQLPSLRRLRLTGCHIVGKQMFEDRDPAATWPSLTDLQLHMSITTPDGRWYFTGDVWSAEMAPDDLEDDPDESAATFDSADSDMSDFAPAHTWEKENGNTPYCSFRLKPDGGTFDPFMTAKVRAVAHMPVLRRLELCLSNSSRSGVDANYFGPKEPGKGDMSDGGEAFHTAYLDQSRWVLFLRGDFDAPWTLSPALRTALTRTSGEGCVYVTGVQEEQF